MPKPEQSKKFLCPTCSAEILWNEDFPHRPFCSKRCRQVDFGEWANENHKIAGASIYEDSSDVDSENFHENYQ